ncbi:g1571 [Coccomyxa viridis]|uniref:G1571 protein n=1 Tax=Coccomyxa viridis TaxID=1274662 RepID=A0ABP1FIA5_9CHLO
MPLHLLDDEGFCTEIADVITAYLQDHPTSELLSRGQRWVHLKRHLRLRATTAALRTARARRQALRALEMDSRTAQAQYEANPADAASLLAWRQAHHLLQQLNAAASHSAAVQAGVVWQHYGEQSTFWFYHLARERQAQTTITQLHTSTEPLQTVTLDSFESTQQAAQALETYYSASTPEGLFAPPQTSLDAQDALLAAVDRHLTPAQQQQGEGAAGDGSISLEDLTQALSSLPRGKAPGFDGLPYEFYQRFWEQLGPELTAVLQAAFQPDGPGQLPPDMTEGRITLLYKGKGLDRALPASYRPITLLNTDYKLAARVLADRLGPLLNHVVDSTQTGFLPQRWIGDNILAHLEIIAWYQRTQQPGVLLFLDFEKAFDRLDRPWLQRCMAATGFGAGAQRWVSLMHASTSAKVAFNGWHTQRFPVQSGVFQGSPLSPLLFVLAVQPMSAHARQLATQQGLHGLRLPDGQASPFLHLHADDTTVHASTPADAQAVLDGSIALHVDATGARLQRSKSIGMGIGSLQHLVGPDQATGVTFSAAGTSVRHLGIPLSTDAGRAAETLYADILQRLHTRIARWSGFRLSLLGRAHVAKQVLVSMFTYHGTFIPVPEQLLRQLCTAVYTFVAANRPVVAGAAHLYPSRDVSSRAVDQGGIALVDIRAQLTALQAKVIGRLLEPEHIAWKAFFDSWLSMPLTAGQILSTPPQQQHIWQLGRYLPFSSFSTRFIDAPARVTAYIDAFRQLHPHRLVAVEDLPYQEVMSQPLFHSWQIQHMGTPISWEAWARQGRVRLQHLRDIILSGTARTQPALQQEVTLLLDSMPASWAAHVCGPAPQPTQLVSAAAGDSRVFCPDADGQLIHTYTVTPTAALQPALPLPEASQQPPLPADLRPVLVMDWDPTRPWHPRHMGPQARAGDADAVPAQPQPQPQLAISPHLVGAWSAGVIDPRSWGFGSEPAHEYVVRTRASRLRTLRRIIAGLPDAVSSMRPAIWPAEYGDEHSGIRRLESFFFFFFFLEGETLHVGQSCQ